MDWLYLSVQAPGYTDEAELLSPADIWGVVHTDLSGLSSLSESLPTIGVALGLGAPSLSGL